jgi:DivIVA domain-containing protein
MAPESNIFQTSFRGYDKAQVDSYIRKLMDEGENALEEIDRKADDIASKNESMRQEILELEAEQASQVRSKEFAEFLEERLERARGIMKADAEDEIKVIESASLEKIETLEAEIVDLKDYFKKVQENFNILLHTVIEPSPVNAITEKNGFKVIQYDRRSSHKKMLHNGNSPEKPKYSVGTHILGKIVGRDLVDKAGSLIASKGEVISEEIVEKAENAGKLSELIINMAIPGVDG